MNGYLSIALIAFMLACIYFFERFIYNWGWKKKEKERKVYLDRPYEKIAFRVLKKITSQCFVGIWYDEDALHGVRNFFLVGDKYNCLKMDDLQEGKSFFIARDLQDAPLFVSFDERKIQICDWGYFSSVKAKGFNLKEDEVVLIYNVHLNPKSKCFVRIPVPFDAKEFTDSIRFGD